MKCSLLSITDLHNVPTLNTDVFFTHDCNVTLELGAGIFSPNLTARSEILTFLQSVTKSPEKYATRNLFPLSQRPAIYPYPEPDQSSQSRLTLIFKIHVNIILPSRPSSHKWSSFPQQNLVCIPLLPHNAPCPADLVRHYLINLIILGEKYPIPPKNAQKYIKYISIESIMPLRITWKAPHFKMHILKKGNNNTKRLAYTALVRPTLECGAVCWDP